MWSNISFGGVLISNTKNVATAQEINSLFCEVVIAPGYDNEALTILQERKTESF
jgi:phosphoribosylaminoimidazolecarboxamide formyltransferase/IMP cyclohydrolase